MVSKLSAKESTVERAAVMAVEAAAKEAAARATVVVVRARAVPWDMAHS